MASRPVIAVDADGVLLDFNLGYAGAWQRAFGVHPKERDPLAYWPHEQWEVEMLEGERWQHFLRHFDEGFWSSVPALNGALAACHRLHDAGIDLVCVTALDLCFEKARLRNLRELGFPIERVIATGNAGELQSPKADAIAALRPQAFVDDYLPYLRGVPADVHAALIVRSPNGSPNVGDDLRLAHSTHTDLAAFAAAWLKD
jgi:phosphoglycolate phosphatase-like HAD superfamily hydrolase